MRKYIYVDIKFHRTPNLGLAVLLISSLLKYVRCDKNALHLPGREHMLHQVESNKLDLFIPTRW